MIKSEMKEDGTEVSIKGNTLTLSSKLGSIVDSLADGKSKKVLDTIFLHLSEYYTKDEMCEFIDRAFAVKEFTSSDIGEAIEKLFGFLTNKKEEE